MIPEHEVRAADARRKLKRAEAKQPATCQTCSNKVSVPWFTQCDSCIAQNVDIADFEAAEIILDRVMAGTCQSCGKTKGCTCRYVDPNKPLGIVVGFQNG